MKIKYELGGTVYTSLEEQKLDILKKAKKRLSKTENES